MNDGKEKLSEVISGKNWKIRLNKDEIKSITLKQMLGILFDKEYDSRFVKEFPTLYAYVNDVYSNDTQKYLSAASPDEFKKYFWSNAWARIIKKLNNDGGVFYGPYKGLVTKADIISGRIIKDDGDTKDTPKETDVSFINRVNQATDDIGRRPIVKDKRELDKEKRASKKKSNKEMPNIETPKIETNQNKSVEEQIKNTVTKIAKNKQLMDLSKEQLRDYLRDAYEISDENALNNMMNAVVAKRAELLANDQLKQEEMTEIDIGKLQEQSQRDFEKKLNDQNLRYILPAQIEKRERLVQNRLNPELLKGGY